MSDPIPTISESEATGLIAQIYADIRSVYRVNAVNLVWRHLATIPGGLPWVWGDDPASLCGWDRGPGGCARRGALSSARVPPVDLLCGAFAANASAISTLQEQRSSLLQDSTPFLAKAYVITR
jgi:hypothetical protein